MPYWLTPNIFMIKGQQQMKAVSNWMAAFEKIGERGDPTESNNILGAPKIKLDEWLQQKKSKTS